MNRDDERKAEWDAAFLQHSTPEQLAALLAWYENRPYLTFVPPQSKRSRANAIASSSS